MTREHIQKPGEQDLMEKSMPQRWQFPLALSSLLCYLVLALPVAVSLVPISPAWDFWYEQVYPYLQKTLGVTLVLQPALFALSVICSLLVCAAKNQAPSDKKATVIAICTLVLHGVTLAIIVSWVLRFEEHLLPMVL